MTPSNVHAHDTWSNYGHILKKTETYTTSILVPTCNYSNPSETLRRTGCSPEASRLIHTEDTQTRSSYSYSKRNEKVTSSQTRPCFIYKQIPAKCKQYKMLRQIPAAASNAIGAHCSNRSHFDTLAQISHHPIIFGAIPSVQVPTEQQGAEPIIGCTLLRTLLRNLRRLPRHPKMRAATDL